MSLSIGIVGLPNVGKSTLFNALLKKRVALSANYPFATIEPNIGVVPVPDARLAVLGEIVKKEEKIDYIPPLVPATIEFVDIAGLVKGASIGAGLGNQFLSHIREVDAIIHVIRDFDDPDIIREGSTDPESDRQVIETELALADLQTLDKLFEHQQTEIKKNNDIIEKNKIVILQNLKNNLDKGNYEEEKHTDERLTRWFHKLPLLIIKPALRVYNVTEKEYSQKYQERPDEIIICAKLEEELADYSEQERLAYLDTVGIKQTGLEKLIQKSYSSLGLISFLTAGTIEVKAWTIRQGTKAPGAAGVIHTDFEKGFIKVQVVSYEDLVKAGSLVEAKKLGKLRIEGKEYIMKDGDVVEFMFNK